MAESLKSKISKTNIADESIPRFLRTVFQILEDQLHSEYICWSQDGRAVMIKNPVNFAQDLLPIYFKHSNYTSFVRQLNLYAFRKQKNYPYDNAFAHNMFIRGRQDLLKYIKRKGYGANRQNEQVTSEEVLSEDTPRWDEASEQHRCVKQVNKDVSDRLNLYEDQAKEIMSKNELLQRQIQKKEQNEVFLKKLITKISKVYGCENVRALVNSVREEVQKDEKNSFETNQLEKELDESIFYDNLFSRKISTASTSADLSEISLYPFLDEQPATLPKLEHNYQDDDQANFWREEANKLGNFLPRTDSDFGISGLNSEKMSFYPDKSNNFLNFEITRLI